MAKTPRYRRISVLIDSATEYGRSCLLGIARYSRCHPQWQFHIHHRWPYEWRMDLTSWHGDGVIAQVHDERLAASLARLSVPVLNISSVLAGLPFPQVISDNHKAGTMGAEHLLSLHYRSMGYVGFPGHAYSKQIERGFVAAVRREGRLHYVYAVDPQLAREHSWIHELASLTKWLRKLSKPAAILACNDLRARHVMAVCLRLGLRIPDDVAIMGVGNDELTCEFVNPPLSSVVVGPERIGFRAANLLDRIVSGNDAPRHPVLIAPQGIRPRRSTDALKIEDPDVAEAVRFIRANIHRPIQVSDVVSQGACSRRALERRFSEVLGHSPGEEIQQWRIKKAAELLAQSDLPIAGIARECGYSNSARLHEAFRRAMRVSPSRYRQKLEMADLRS